MMDEGAVTAIAELAQDGIGQAAVVSTDVGQRATRQLYTIPREEKPDTPAVLEIASLTGLVDYLEANRDGLVADEIMVHVENPARVVVGSRLVDRMTRHRYLAARASDQIAGFLEKWVSMEDFNIFLRTRIEDAGARDEVLEITGHVSAEAEVLTEDDGYSQSVTTTRGLKHQTPVPNPIELTGYRTFHEVAQPSVPYVLRLSDKGVAPQAKLLEASEKWRSDVVEEIYQWLRERIDTSIAIIR